MSEDNLTYESVPENVRTGICRNYHYADNEPCPECLDKVLQSVAGDEPYVCRVCGRPLFPAEDGLPSSGVVAEHVRIGLASPPPVAPMSMPAEPRKKIGAGVIAAIAIGVVIVVAAAVVLFILPAVAEKDSVDVAPTEHAAPENLDEGLQLAYGVWDGASKLGQPDGQGTLKYTHRRLISQFDTKAIVANPGDYIIGEFATGQLVHGKLYRTDGSTEYIATDLPVEDIEN